MKILWYGLTLFTAVLGILALLRFLELQLTSGGFFPSPLIMAIIFLPIAYVCLKKARAS